MNPRDLLTDKRQLMAVYARMDRADNDVNFLLVSLSHWLRNCERLMDANKAAFRVVGGMADEIELLRAENRELTGRIKEMEEEAKTGGRQNHS